MFNKKSFSFLFAVIFVFISFAVTTSVFAATVPPLGNASSFAILGGSGITNTGATTVTGDVGTHPTATETGFTGANTVTITGVNHEGDTTTESAKADLATAYADAAGQAVDTNLSGTDLGGLTLGPGVYKFDTSAQLTGTLTLDGGGNPNAVFIFQIGSTLTTASSSSVTLINSAQAHNVFWQVGTSATLGTNTDFKGNILAFASITDDGGSTIHGGLLAINALVTLNNTTVFIHTPGSVTIESATLRLASDDPMVSGDNDTNGYANIGDHINIRLTVSNTDGGCNTIGTHATVDLTKYGGPADASLMCYTDNGGVHDLLALGFDIINAGVDGIDVGVNSGSSVAISVSDNDDSTTTTTNNLGDGVDDAFTTLGVDTIAPVVTNVTATQHDATYKAGDTIDITVSFNKNVYANSASQPTITLNSSATPIHMVGGNGFNTWNFTYVVGAGDSATTLDYADTSSFALGTTTIKGNHGGVFFNDAVLDLPALGGGSSLSQQNIVIDGLAPTVTRLGNTSGSYALPSTCPSTACNRGDIYGTVLVFSEILSDTTKTAVEAAITAAASVAPRTYVWNNNVLRIYATEAVTFSTNVFADLTDLAGNTASHQLLIQVVPASEVWVNSEYSSGNANGGHLWNYDAFTTPQNGLDAVAMNGTVNLASETYVSDSSLTISKSGVTLTGPNPTDSESFPYIQNNDCGIVVDVRAPDVVVQGLYLEQNGGTPGDYCHSNPIVRVYGVSNTHIEHNEIVGGAVGVAIRHNSATTTIDTNRIHNNDIGIVMFTSNNTITNNEIYNNSGSNGYGISMGCGGDGCSSYDMSGTVISGNSIHMNSYGIYYRAGNQSSAVNIGPANNIYGNTEGIYINGNAGNLGIHGNSIHDNPGIASGLHVENTMFLDASRNWWGDASGPKVNDEGPGTSWGSETITTVNSPLVFFRPFCTGGEGYCDSLSSVETSPTNITDHFTDGVFTIEGEDYAHASAINLAEDLTISVEASGGTSSVDIPSGTVITRADDGLMNGGDLTAADIATGSLSGLDSTVTAEGALQWGIPGVTLEFNPAVTLHIFVGTDLNGQTLDVKRSPSGTGEWTSDGIVDPATCLVASGICTFQATKASTYVSTVNNPVVVSSGASRNFSPSFIVPLLALNQNTGCEGRTTGFNTITGKPCGISTTTTTEQVSGTAPYHFKLLLRYGSRGKEVTELQKFLVKAGYDSSLVPNGNFGPRTKAAVIKLQKENKMKKADGIVGALTREILNK